MATKRDAFSVGSLVEHPKRPNWGPGRIVAVGEGRLHVFFRDDLENKAKVLLAEQAGLKVCEEQTDTVLDGLPPAKFDGQNWVLPKAKAKRQSAAALAAAAAAKAE